MPGAGMRPLLRGRARGSGLVLGRLREPRAGRSPPRAATGVAPASFCTRVDSAGMVICPVCGEENPERARFCLACGAPLEGREESSGEERRLVTVVFCELVGLGETGTDPEELKR